MTLLKHINSPSLLLPYEQIYTQQFHHKNQLIPEQRPNEQNPMFQLLHDKQQRSHHTWDLINITKGKTPSEGEAFVNSDLVKIEKWAKDNKMQFNETKSKAILITRKRNI